MKVLYDHQIFLAQKFGGISRYFNELMQFDEPGIITKKIEPELINKKQAADIPDLLVRAARSARRRIGIKTVHTPRKTPSAITDILTGENYDLFHPTYYHPYFLDYVRKPFVLTVYDMIHEIYTEYFSTDDPTTRNKKLLCDKAAHIIAISEKTKEDLIRIFGLPESKITTILLASSFHTDVSQRPANFNDVGKFILFTGSRNHYKNFYYPVIALSQLLRSDRELNILCSGHAFSASEMQFFKDFGIEKQVHHVYLKTDAELAWAYSNAELFIFPSLYEGFGFPLLEAFACHCPVICSTGGSLPEVAGNAAIYFDPKNYTQICDAAASVLYNTETKKVLVSKGQEQLHQFSWDKCRRETYEVYKSIVES